MVQRVMYGEVTNEKNANLPDLNPREWATLLPLVFLALFMGVFSSLFTPSIEKPVMKIIQDARARTLPSTDRLRVVPPAPSESPAAVDKGAQQ
jgi:NADH-quinone oxidoreductase subunit M